MMIVTSTPHLLQREVGDINNDDCNIYSSFASEGGGGYKNSCLRQKSNVFISEMTSHDISIPFPLSSLENCPAQ